jgi:hypothetical protein
MLGNVTVTGVWSYLLWQNRHEVPPRQIARGILWTDLFFTLFGGALITVAGVMMIRTGGMPWRDMKWLLRGIEVLAAATLIWLVVLIPDQMRMERCKPGEEARFGRLFVRWSVCGWAITMLLFWGIWLMVTKPA